MHTDIFNHYTETTTSQAPNTETTLNTVEPNPRPCDDLEWQCLNGECIYAPYKCDGTVDCSDGSDEGPICYGK